MGMACRWFVILSLILSSQLLPGVQVREEIIPPKVISGGGSDHCLPQEERNAALGEISSDILDILDRYRVSVEMDCGTVWLT
jgi:hypothetical protein